MRYHQLLNEASKRFTREEFKPFIARKLMNSSLIGRVPRDGKRYGITTGSLDEWANYFTALAEVESSFKHSATGDIGKFVGNSNGLYQLSPNDAKTYGFQGSKPFSIQQLQNPDTNAEYAIKIHERLLNGKANWSIKRGPGRYWGPIKRDSKRFFNALGTASQLNQLGPNFTQQQSPTTPQQSVTQQQPAPQQQTPKINPYEPPSPEEITAMNKKFGPIDPSIDLLSGMQVQQILKDPSITKMPAPGDINDPGTSSDRLTVGQTQRIINDPTFTEMPVNATDTTSASDDIVKNWKKIEPKATPDIVPASNDAISSSPEIKGKQP